MKRYMKFFTGIVFGGILLVCSACTDEYEANNGGMKECCEGVPFTVRAIVADFEELSNAGKSSTRTSVRDEHFKMEFVDGDSIGVFAGEDGVKRVRVLSGGEKVRCLLSKMMISGANVLVLDEPTNHLDMESITALNNGLIKFPGVLLFTCHDHQFVQTTANRIMEIVNGKLIDKITTYDEYLANDEMARKRQVFTVTDSEEEDD